MDLGQADIEVKVVENASPRHQIEACRIQFQSVSIHHVKFGGLLPVAPSPRLRSQLIDIRRADIHPYYRSTLVKKVQT